ncbi:FecR family protein [Leptospira limi]|uniref:FecR domain-containing protein n=1 Tax=Leptospira limi TaxID=2950023 RepID=A0ABT3M050_9LEPT|nr:FecR family protein [Leptospira limi]MCW7463360.1 FecR domain-containing protein [Leptospira limi]
MKKLVILFLLTLTFSQCEKFSFGQKDSKDETAGAVVTFLQGQVVLMKEGKETFANLGDVVKPGDRILSKLGKVDLQTYRGEVIRIKENSDVLFRDLAGDKQPNTELFILAGNLLVKSVKLKANQNLSISSPTMVAGVRGTIFSFELEKGSVPKVKVYEGAVAVAFKTGPKLVELNDGLSKENYDQLVKTLEENEIVLESGETMEVNPSLNEMVYIINAKMAASSITKDELAGLTDLYKGISKVESPVTPKEKAEAETLVAIDNSLVQKQVENKAENQAVTQEIVENIEKEHESKRNEALTNITTEAEKMGLQNEEDIQNHYSVLETIHKSNGEVLSGAVVAQLGDIFIVHSTKGVFQLKVDDIEYVEYKNFKVLTKTKK